MNKFLTTKNIVIAVAVMLVVLVLVYLFQTLHPKLPTIISSTPLPNSTGNNVIDPISIKFDLPISSNDFSIASIPEESWVVTQRDTQTISINHSQYLTSNTSYALNLIYKSKSLTSLAFTTAGGQADPRYYQQIQSDLDLKYPLAKYTPYSTHLYRVVYSAPMTLEITVKSPNIPSAQAISDIKAWVASVGGDAAAHQYTISAVSPKP